MDRKKSNYFTKRFLIFLCMNAFWCFDAYGQCINEIDEGINETNAYYLNGTLDFVQLRQFRSALEKSPSIQTVVVDSSGGMTTAGMAIASLIFDKKLNVIIDGGCYSSCANYILAAAKHTIVKRCSVIGWHGGATQYLYINTDGPNLNSYKDNDKRLAVPALYRDIQEERTEIDFYNKVGVEQAITVIGMMKGFAERRTGAVYTYDILTLRRLGLKIDFEVPQKSIPKKLDLFEIEQELLSELLSHHQQRLSSYN